MQKTFPPQMSLQQGNTKILPKGFSCEDLNLNGIRYRPGAREAVQNGHGLYRRRVPFKVASFGLRLIKGLAGYNDVPQNGKVSKVVQGRAIAQVIIAAQICHRSKCRMAILHGFVVTGPYRRGRR